MDCSSGRPSPAAAPSHHAAEVADAHDPVEYVGYVSEERKREILSEGACTFCRRRQKAFRLPSWRPWPAGTQSSRPMSDRFPPSSTTPTVRSFRQVTWTKLTAALERLLSDPSTTERMGAVSRQRIEDSYAWPDVVGSPLALCRGAGRRPSGLRPLTSVSTG